MRRREFIAAAGGAAAWSFAVGAQQPAVPVIGYFSGRSPDAEAPIRVPFLKALEGLGFATGRNIAIEYRFAEGQDERLPGLAAELVRRQVAMLVATDRPSALAAKRATETIPIVFTSGFDPVELGLAASFNRPGGNATGVSLLTTALGPKRLALVRELWRGQKEFLVERQHRAHGVLCALPRLPLAGTLRPRLAVATSPDRRHRALDHFCRRGLCGDGRDRLQPHGAWQNHSRRLLYQRHWHGVGAGARVRKLQSRARHFRHNHHCGGRAPALGRAAPLQVDG